MLCALGSQAQSTYRALPEDGVWRVDIEYWNPFQINACRAHFHFQYYFDGDTIIDSKRYSKLYRSEIDTTVEWCLDLNYFPEFPDSGYVGAIREDTAANANFIMFAGTTIDSLLYDYNLEVGDSLRGAMVVYSAKRPVVTSIYSVVIDGSYHKRWNFSAITFPWPEPEYPYLIEGIGSNVGLFEHVWSYNLDFRLRNLVCLKRGQSIVFESDHESEFGCNFVSIEEHQVASQQMAIYPNPSKGEFQMTTNIKEPMNVVVFNLVGQTVYSKANVTSNTVINIRDITSGIYFVSFKTDKVNLLRRLVVD